MTTAGICDVCGTTVNRGSEPVRGDGWYSGHQYVWGDIGGGVHGPRLFRVRCSEHPYDMTAEEVEQERDEWGDSAANALARDYDRPDLVRVTGAAGWRRDEMAQTFRLTIDVRLPTQAGGLSAAQRLAEITANLINEEDVYGDVGQDAEAVAWSAAPVKKR